MKETRELVETPRPGVVEGDDERAAGGPATGAGVFAMGRWNQDLGEHPVVKLLIAGAALVIVVAGLRAAQVVFVPLALALFLSSLSLPLLQVLLRRRLPLGAAVVATMLAVVTALGALGWLINLALSRITSRAPQYMDVLQERVRLGVTWLDARGIRAVDWLSPDWLDSTALVELVSTTFRSVAAVVTLIFLVLLIMTFILLESYGFGEKLHRALGDRGEILGRFSKITREVQRYLIIKTLISLVTGLLVGLLVTLLGLDFPFFLGILAFLLNFIPNIGSILAAIPALGLAWLQSGLSGFVLTLLGYLAINVGMGNLLEPQLLGRRLSLSPLVVVLSLVFWGWVWGPPGMLLSVPLTMALKIVLENSEGLGWAARLMGR